jgi:hypothetical protein
MIFPGLPGVFFCLRNQLSCRDRGGPKFLGKNLLGALTILAAGRLTSTPDDLPRLAGVFFCLQKQLP